jgi:hypothetical protein
MNVGAGIGSTNNQALDTLIANNAISAAPGAFGIRIAAGVGSASASLIDGMQVIGNQIDIIDQTASANELGVGINLAVGDAASDDADPSLRPIQYSENNIARNIAILSNTIGEAGGFGIFAQAACCGNGNNTIDNLSILGNTMTGVQLIGGSSGVTSAGPRPGICCPTCLSRRTPSTAHPFPDPPNLQPLRKQSRAGNYVIAGLEEPGNSVNGISIANNDVNTPFIGISIVGGLGFPQGPTGSPFPANNNVVAHPQIFCNQIDQLPALGLAPSPESRAST